MHEVRILASAISFKHSCPTGLTGRKDYTMTAFDIERIAYQLIFSDGKYPKKIRLGFWDFGLLADAMEKAKNSNAEKVRQRIEDIGISFTTIDALCSYYVSHCDGKYSLNDASFCNTDFAIDLCKWIAETDSFPYGIADVAELEYIKNGFPE